MVISEENLVENPAEECNCRFAVDAHGQPTILCPDEESKAMAVSAMAETGDVLVRVVPVVAHEDGVDQASDEVEEPEEELETGFTDDEDDDADDEDEEE